ncbi:hypothetical protein PSCLAVI8L_340014 [Pseudoclavibacter sp. 8L]|nr:hypothetical protein PSCLAVI8L_340014 [Pseudoclavibacter sp. 8L]
MGARVRGYPYPFRVRRVVAWCVWGRGWRHLATTLRVLALCGTGAAPAELWRGAFGGAVRGT